MTKQHHRLAKRALQPQAETRKSIYTFTNSNNQCGVFSFVTRASSFEFFLVIYAINRLYIILDIFKQIEKLIKKIRKRKVHFIYFAMIRQVELGVEKVGTGWR